MPNHLYPVTCWVTSGIAVTIIVIDFSY